MNGRRDRKTLAGSDQWYAGIYRKEDPQSESLESETKKNKSSAARERIRGDCKTRDGKQGIILLFR